MAGHSHFANIMHKKSRMDAKRGKAFSKVSRLIMAAVKMGGPKPEDNPRLQLALEKARAANMPKDTISRAIDRASGNVDGAIYHDLTYEAYGPSGVAMMIDVLTDNRNRSSTDVRTILDKNGGTLAASGAVAYMFSRQGAIEIPASTTSEEQLFEVALEAGAEEIELLDADTEEARFLVGCAAPAFEAVKKAILDAGLEPTRAEYHMVPGTSIDADEATARKIMRIQGLLEDNDDVQTVTTNLEVSAEVAAKLAAG